MSSFVSFVHEIVVKFAALVLDRVITTERALFGLFVCTGPFFLSSDVCISVIKFISHMAFSYPRFILFDSTIVLNLGSLLLVRWLTWILYSCFTWPKKVMPNSRSSAKTLVICGWTKLLSHISHKSDNSYQSGPSRIAPHFCQHQVTFLKRKFLYFGFLVWTPIHLSFPNRLRRFLWTK